MIVRVAHDIDDPERAHPSFTEREQHAESLELSSGQRDASDHWRALSKPRPPLLRCMHSNKPLAGSCSQCLAKPGTIPRVEYQRPTEPPKIAGVGKGEGLGALEKLAGKEGDE